MFNINGWELAVIAILFILLFGPEKIPEVVVEVTRLIRQVRSLADGATADLRREIEHAAADARAARDVFGEAGSDVSRRLEEATRVHSIGNPAKKGGAEVMDGPSGDVSVGPSTSTDVEPADLSTPVNSAGDPTDSDLQANGSLTGGSSGEEPSER